MVLRAICLCHSQQPNRWTMETSPKSFAKWFVHSTLPSPKQPLSHSMFTHHHHLDGTDFLGISFFQKSCQVSYSWQTLMLTEMTAKLAHVPFSTGRCPTHHYVPQIFQKLCHEIIIEQTSVCQDRCPRSLLISWPNIVETPLLNGFSCVWWAMSRQHFVDAWFQNFCVRDPARLPQTWAGMRQGAREPPGHLGPMLGIQGSVAMGPIPAAGATAGAGTSCCRVLIFHAMSQSYFHCFT